MKVLVVDDEKPVRDVLQKFLLKEGYDVSLADNGRTGLEKFDKEIFDIVFLDVMMPGLDGIEIFHRMKPKHPGTKFIVITGFLDETTFKRAMSVFQYDVDAFLTKPFELADIKNCLNGLLPAKN